MEKPTVINLSHLPSLRVMAAPTWRNRYVAASGFNLRGSGGPDNELAKRTRAALQA